MWRVLAVVLVCNWWCVVCCVLCVVCCRSCACVLWVVGLAGGGSVNMARIWGRRPARPENALARRNARTLTCERAGAAAPRPPAAAPSAPSANSSPSWSVGSAVTSTCCDCCYLNVVVVLLCRCLVALLLVLFIVPQRGASPVTRPPSSPPPSTQPPPQTSSSSSPPAPHPSAPPHRLAEPKVGQLHVAVAVEQQVVGLDVAVVA